jgi:hypothetical protein
MLFVILTFLTLGLGVGILIYVRINKLSVWDLEVQFCTMLISFGVGLILLTLVISLPLSFQSQLAMFKLQKAYIEQLAPAELANAGVVTKKLEYNDWLYEAQYELQHFPFTTLYPAEILKLTPIR